MKRNKVVGLYDITIIFWTMPIHFIQYNQWTVKAFPTQMG